MTFRLFVLLNCTFLLVTEVKKIAESFKKIITLLDGFQYFLQEKLSKVKENLDGICDENDTLPDATTELGKMRNMIVTR